MEKNIKSQMVMIDIIRGFAVLFVFFTHCSIFWRYDDYIASNPKLSNYIIKLNNVIHITTVHPGVLIFIVLSGFIIHFTTNRKGENNWSFFKDYIRKRFLRIYPIFFLAITAGLILKLSTEADFYNDFKSYFLNLILLYGVVKIPEPVGNGVMVTVSTEMWLYVAYGLFIPYISSLKHWAYLLIIASFLFILNTVQAGFGFNYWSLRNFYAFLLYWSLGAFFAELAIRQIKISWFVPIVAYSLALIGHYNIQTFKGRLWIDVVTAIALGAILAKTYSYKVKEHVISYIGKAGYSIYAFHMILFYWLAVTIYKKYITSITGGLLLFFSALLVSIGIFVIVEKPLHEFTSKKKI